MENSENKKRFKKIDRLRFMLDGFTEKEIDDIEKAWNEDRNISRFTDPEIITLNELNGDNN